MYSYLVRDKILGVWTHIGASYHGDKAKLKIFVNGVKILTTDTVTKVKQIYWGQKMVIGKYLDAVGGDTGMYLQGYMDEFYIFEAVRDESSVKKLMEKCDYPTGGKLTQSLRFRTPNRDNNSKVKKSL